MLLKYNMVQQNLESLPVYSVELKKNILSFLHVMKNELATRYFLFNDFTYQGYDAFKTVI